MRRGLTVLTLAVLLAVPGALLAQEATEEEQAPSNAPRASDYAQPDEGWKDHRFHVGAYYGGLAGGTAVGLAENLLFRTQFEIDSGSLLGVRGGWVFASRFDLEAEYGRSSPGLNAVLTNLSGQGKTVVPFADLDISHLMAVVNYSVIDRNKRLVPYLSLGVGMVRSSSGDDARVGNTETGIVYGGGLRFWLIDELALRADVRGMRSGLGSNQDKTGDIPGVFVNDFNASFLLWGVGLDFRF
jgi:outer membrane beta-barrel protein